jgi:hypothetical protein
MTEAQCCTTAQNILLIYTGTTLKLAGHVITFTQRIIWGVL